jgi:hypothetical protein
VSYAVSVIERDSRSALLSPGYPSHAAWLDGMQEPRKDEKSACYENTTGYISQNSKRLITP